MPGVGGGVWGVGGPRYIIKIFGKVITVLFIKQIH